MKLILFTILLIVGIVFLKMVRLSNPDFSIAKLAQPPEPTAQEIINTSEEKVILYFWESGNADCDKTTPFIDQVLTANPSFKSAKIDAKKKSSVGVLTTHNVKKLPTVIVYQKKKQIARHEGPVATKNELLKVLKLSKPY